VARNNMPKSGNPDFLDEETLKEITELLQDVGMSDKSMEFWQHVARYGSNKEREYLNNWKHAEEMIKILEQAIEERNLTISRLMYTIDNLTCNGPHGDPIDRFKALIEEVEET